MFAAPPLPGSCVESDEVRKDGTTVVLRYCDLTSPVQLSELNFDWTKRSKNGELSVIRYGGRFRVNHHGWLTIQSVGPSDSGVYLVNISNSQGSALHKIPLEVTSGKRCPRFQPQTSLSLMQKFLLTN